MGLDGMEHDTRPHQERAHSRVHTNSVFYNLSSPGEVVPILTRRVDALRAFTPFMTWIAIDIQPHQEGS